jgi:hypothetical protein
MRGKIPVRNCTGWVLSTATQHIVRKTLAPVLGSSTDDDLDDVGARIAEVGRVAAGDQAMGEVGRSCRGLQVAIDDVVGLGATRLADIVGCA